MHFSISALPNQEKKYHVHNVNKLQKLFPYIFLQ